MEKDSTQAAPTGPEDAGSTEGRLAKNGISNLRGRLTGANLADPSFWLGRRRAPRASRTSRRHRGLGRRQAGLLGCQRRPARCQRLLNFAGPECVEALPKILVRRKVKQGRVGFFIYGGVSRGRILLTRSSQPSRPRKSKI